MRIDIPYGDTSVAINIPQRNLLAVASPNPVPACADPTAEIRRALEQPIGAPRLREAIKGARHAVILADDMTRQTPVEILLPLLLDEINAGGLRDEQVTVVIALGTHRCMTPGEIRDHFGEEVTRRVRVINNPWQDPSQMVDLGVTGAGTPVSVSRVALEADFLIGAGSIVPHHIPGYSGGGKIVQPGVCGAETTGATHFLSTKAAPSLLGQVENPVRAEIERIAAQVGLKAILNVVLDPAGQLVRAFYGDPVLAHRSGVEVSRQVYGVRLPAQAEIVVAGSHPCDIEFWQAHKALYAAELAVKPGGSMIVVTPCPEDVAVMHPGLLSFTGRSSIEIQAAIESGEIHDQVSGALALAWAKAREHAPVSLVSDGISAEATRALGFTPYPTAQDALAAALQRHGSDARVILLPYAPDTLPYLE